MYRTKQWFTFVELIVAVIIIALLWVIGVAQFVDRWASIRDASRVAQMSEIFSAITSHNITNRIPVPNNKVNITASGQLIWYQWDIGDVLLETINFNGDGIDPRTQEYYSIILDKNKKNFQILWFLENENEFAVSQNTNNVIVKWNQLWVLMDEYGLPIQRMNQLSGILDIQNTPNTFISVFSEQHSIKWNGEQLWLLKTVFKQWGIYKKSCKKALWNDDSLLNRDGIYAIGLDNSQVVEVYCNMTFDWWGWTLFYANNGLADSPVKESYVTMRDNVIENNQVYNISDYDSPHLSWLVDYRFLTDDTDVELLAVNRNEFSNGRWAKVVFSDLETFQWALSSKVLWSTSYPNQCVDIINWGKVSFYISNGSSYENLSQIMNHHWGNIWISHWSYNCNWYTSSIYAHLLFYVSTDNRDERRTRSSHWVWWSWWGDNQYRYFVR